MFAGLEHNKMNASSVECKHKHRLVACNNKTKQLNTSTVTLPSSLSCLQFSTLLVENSEQQREGGECRNKSICRLVVTSASKAVQHTQRASVGRVSEV